MRIVVLGGGGFIGSHVADALNKKGHKVTIFDKKKSKWIKDGQKMVIGNILNYQALEKVIKKNQIVYNFAALADLDLAMEEPIITAKTNILGTVQALNLSRKYKIKRFIQASSLYVGTDQGGFYSCSKRAADDYVKEFNKNYHQNYTILRYGSVYGSRSDKSNGIRKILDKAIFQKKLFYNGNKKAKRKYINVLDAAEASVEILKSKYKNKSIILTGKKLRKVSEVLKFISKKLKINKKIIFKNDKNSKHYAIQPNPYKVLKAQEFKFKKAINLEEGVLSLIRELKN
tara:strand:- start:15312 stop:16172 length:861 start_codon:yes stop_codon:yes gene_type:complete